jgi:hypothetical protein
MNRGKYRDLVTGLLAALAISVLVTNLTRIAPTGAANVDEVRSIIFPVLGGGSFRDDYHAPRASGPHHATDIFAPKMRPLVAAVDGTISFVAYPQPSYGWFIRITDDQGYDYLYIHINNDTPGTDDGQGGAMNAYAFDMDRGNRVVAGQLIGWVGDSGNAETTPPHLHFEIEAPDGTKLNPYHSLVPAPRIGTPTIHPALSREVLPYGVNFIGMNVAMGNFDGDQDSEVVTAPDIGGGPHVRVFDDDNTPTGQEYMAYHPSWHGGVDVAAGDVDGDGTDEIIVGPGPGGGPHVIVYDLDGVQIASFFAYDPAFRGGIRVASGDVDGDGNDEVITATRHGAPHAMVFDVDPAVSVVGSFYAYDPAFQNGFDVAAGDVTGTSADEIITGPGPGGGPHLAIYQANGATVGGFYAYAPNFTGGLRVSVGNVRTGTAKSEILTLPAHNGGPHIRMFNATNIITEGMFMEGWWVGPYDIAAGYDKSRAAAGVNRRATLREGLD